MSERDEAVEAPSAAASRERLRAVEELGDAIRGLTDAAVSTEVGADTLLWVAHHVRDLTPPLAAERRTRAQRPSTDPRGSGRRTYNPATGPGNPLAPPMHVEIADGVAVGTCTLGLAYEGPRGYVHGGVTALLLDQILGHVHAATRRPGMTVELAVRYRRPVPLETPLQITGRPLSPGGGGRTDLFATVSTVAAPHRVLAEANGTFVVPEPDQVRRIFGERRDRADAGDADSG